MRRSDVFTVSGPGAFYNLLLNMNKSPDEKTPERMKQKKKKLLNSFLDKDEKKMSYNRCVRSNSHTHTEARRMIPLHETWPSSGREQIPCPTLMPRHVALCRKLVTTW